jgi:L-asparaginase
VLVAAMRPETALLSDGPQNLLDAMRVARVPGARGVVAVLAGQVHGALDVRKVHTYRLDAFDSGDAGPIAHVEEGRLRQHRAWPDGAPCDVVSWPAGEAQWPRVEIVVSHAGASALGVRALVAAGVQGIVVAGTGNGTVHHLLEAALLEAQVGGIAILRCSRCLNGAVIDAAPAALASAGALTPVQARIELVLRLLAKTQSAEA